MTVAPAAFAVALAGAALMGLAIQRGATCMVAAIDEMVREGRARRALALAEAALWVGGLSSIAVALRWLHMSHTMFRVSGWTVAGGVLLGLGAWVNRACVFGAVARIGSGQWAWLATPVGFFLGTLVPLAGPSPQHAGGAAATGGAIGAALAALFVAAAAWRIREAAQAPRLGAHLWHPHRATLLIALTFMVTLLSAGAWAYTEALSALARHRDAMLPFRLAMAFALLAGAVLGGAIAGNLRSERPGLGALLRCLAGGAMMGLGATLVPGSNDGLILLGLPGLLPHAWVAVATMAISIAAAIHVSQRVGAWRQRSNAAQFR